STGGAGRRHRRADRRPARTPRRRLQPRPGARRAEPRLPSGGEERSDRGRGRRRALPRRRRDGRLPSALARVARGRPAAPDHLVAAPGRPRAVPRPAQRRRHLDSRLLPPRQLGDVVARRFLRGGVGLARTRTLARFFEAQPNEHESEGHRAPNVRKLSELPFLQTRGALWQRLERTLCDLDFVSAKAAAGLTYDLVEDYAAAERALPETRAEERRVAEHTSGLARYARELDDYATRSTDARRGGTLAGAAPGFPSPPPASVPLDAEEALRQPRRGAGAPRRIDRIRAFSQFVNAESHRLAAFAGHLAYVVQQAYNSSGSGPPAVAAEARVAAAPLAAPALLARPWSRTDFESHAPVIRTFDSWV